MQILPSLKNLFIIWSQQWRFPGKKDKVFSFSVLIFEPKGSKRMPWLQEHGEAFNWLLPSRFP